MAPITDTAADVDAKQKVAHTKSGFSTTSSTGAAVLIRDDDLDTANLAALRRAERKMNPIFLLGVFLTIFINYIDRTNLSYASVQMNKQLGFSSSLYGLGAGVFFLVYAIFQLPSNIALDYFGGPRWIAFITAAWGAVAAAFAATNSAATFIALRCLLGVFEAGAFPGMIFYVSMFYPKERTQLPMAAIVLGILASQCFGAAMAAGFLSMDGLGGLHGWQWLFLVEGLLCLLVAAYWLFVMPVNIQSMKFISQADRDVLQAVMDRQKAGEREKRGYWDQIKGALRNPVCLTASLWNFTYFWAYYGILYWAPMIVNAVLGLDITAKGHTQAIGILLTAVPYAIAAFWQVGYSWHSQRTNEKRWHIVASYGVGAIAMIILPTVMGANTYAAFFVFIVATCLTYGAFSISNSYIMGLLGAERGMGGAIQNSLGNIGGFVGPYMIGALKDSTGSYFSGMYLMGAGLLISACVIAIYQPRWSAVKNPAVVDPELSGASAADNGKGKSVDL